MKILSLTGGAAGMYCGTCLRDNMLATELRRMGHDIILLPLYTPTLTDEENVSSDKIFFGGINVYLQQRSSWFRKTRLVDKVLDSSMMLNAVSGRSIAVDPRELGELTVSMLEGERGVLRKEFEKLKEWLRSEPPPDIVDLPYSLVIGLAAPIKEITGRPVCCTLQGEHLFLDGLVEPYRTRSMDLIRSRLKDVDGFIAVSDFYAGFMSRYLGIDRDRIRTVPLGINLEGHAPALKPDDGVFRIGFFARIAPEKGLHMLAEAYKKIRSQLGASRLETAGYLPPEHKPYLDKIARELGESFVYRGSPDREGKIAFLRSLDVMSVPCAFEEPKGLSIIEAMANGIPVVLPRRGAFTEVVAKTGGGLLVEPDDAGALADGLLELWRDRAKARALGNAGAAGAHQHYNVAQMAQRTIEAYSDIISPAYSRAGT